MQKEDLLIDSIFDLCQSSLDSAFKIRRQLVPTLAASLRKRFGKGFSMVA
jgi:hypothetical protein